MPGDLCTAPRIILVLPLSLATDVTDATLGASGLWLGTRTGAGGTHGSMTAGLLIDIDNSGLGCQQWQTIRHP